VRLRIDEITAEAREISFAVPEEGVNRLLSQGAMREFNAGGPIAVTLEFYRAGMELFFQGRLEAPAVAACARCAEDFSELNARDFRFILAPRAAGLGADRGLRNEELEFSVYEGEEIDLTPLIVEQLILALPSRALCREDCQGLCPRCGTNLNAGPCQCPADAPGPRLAMRLPRVDRS